MLNCSVATVAMRTRFACWPTVTLGSVSVVDAVHAVAVTNDAGSNAIVPTGCGEPSVIRRTVPEWFT
jgi:hypothetical protein